MLCRVYRILAVLGTLSGLVAATPARADRPRPKIMVQGVFKGGVGSRPSSFDVAASNKLVEIVKAALCDTKAASAEPKSGPSDVNINSCEIEVMDATQKAGQPLSPNRACIQDPSCFQARIENRADAILEVDIEQSSAATEAATLHLRIFLNRNQPVGNPKLGPDQSADCEDSGLALGVGGQCGAFVDDRLRVWYPANRTSLMTSQGQDSHPCYSRSKAKTLRIAGGITLGLGILGTATGGALIGIGGRLHGSTMSCTVDGVTYDSCSVRGDEYRTPGGVMLGVGVALGVSGAVLLAVPAFQKRKAGGVPCPN